MGERELRIEDMATSSTEVSTVQPQLPEESTQPVAVITLRPTQTRKQERKKVVWTEDTIDNEDMNKKKSKCCCIYEKPHKFGESDSEESDDECEHCQGHVEKKKHKHDQPSTSTEARSAQPAQPSVSLPLRPPHPPDGPSTS